MTLFIEDTQLDKPVFPEVLLSIHVHYLQDNEMIIEREKKNKNDACNYHYYMYQQLICHSNHLYN